MEVTELGMIISLSAQLLKVLSLMEVIPLPMMALDREAQSLKAPLPMEVTESGMIISVNEEQ